MASGLYDIDAVGQRLLLRRRQLAALTGYSRRLSEREGFPL